MTTSRVAQYLDTKGWAYKPGPGNELIVDTCPLNGCDGGHFYIRDEGACPYNCKKCSASGTLYELRKELGEVMEGVTSYKTDQPTTFPDIARAQEALLSDASALTYLTQTRGFTIEIIKRCRLGVETLYGQRWLLIPYYNGGTLAYVKSRTLPPAKKEFRNTSGRAVPLYNGDVLQAGLKELYVCEGELDCVSMLMMGFENTVAVPGANTQKAEWLVKLDQVNPEVIYILLDRDKVGQKAARELAVRLGIEKCRNICLPEFLTFDGQAGKDVNEYFRAGHTLKQFQELKEAAKPFDVAGVSTLADALDEVERDLEGAKQGGTETSLDTPWPPLSQRLGGVEYGDLVAISAEAKFGKTTCALNWLEYYVREKHVSCLMFCLEMAPKRLARKWASFVTSTDDTPGRSQMTPEIVREAKALANDRDAELLFGFTRFSKPEEVFNTIRQAVRRYGIRVVCFDNLQLLVRSIENAAQETSKLTKMFKELCLELNIVVLLIVQPNRVREGQIVQARNAAGSSAVEKDVDSYICLHRHRKLQLDADDFAQMKFVEQDETFDPEMLVSVDLSRYSAGGRTTLYMDGARSTVSAFPPAERAKVEEQRRANAPQMGGFQQVEVAEI